MAHGCLGGKFGLAKEIVLGIDIRTGLDMRKASGIRGVSRTKHAILATSTCTLGQHHWTLMIDESLSLARKCRIIPRKCDQIPCSAQYEEAVAALATARRYP